MTSTIRKRSRRTIPIHRFTWLMRRPVFWQLTILVHGLLFCCAGLFYWLESDSNPALKSFQDALYWAVTTATSVGYGDITTQTYAGKWLSMGLMVLGTLFSALYTALFAAALMKPEIDHIEQEIIQEELKVESLSRKIQSLNDRDS